MSMFTSYEEMAKLYKGKADTIEKLYEECVVTCDWGWGPIKRMQENRLPLTDISKVDPETGLKRKKKYITEDTRTIIYGKEYWFKKEAEYIMEEWMPQLNYDSILISKLMVEFKNYINAMMRKFSKSIPPDEVMYIAQDQLLWAIALYRPDSIKDGNKTSFKQTFNRMFFSHLTGHCQKTSKLKRTGRDKYYTKKVVEKLGKDEINKKDPAVLVNSLDDMIEIGAMPSSNFSMDEVNERLNIEMFIESILYKFKNEEEQNNVKILISQILDGDKVSRSSAIVKKLAKIIAENRNSLFKGDLIPASI